MLSDIEIAQVTKPKHINDVAKTAGIPKHPAAEKIDVDEDGKIIGLF